MSTTLIHQRQRHLFGLNTFNALLAGAALSVAVVAIANDDVTKVQQPAAAVQSYEAHQAEVYTAKSHATPRTAEQPRVLDRTDRGEDSNTNAEVTCSPMPGSRC